MFNIENCIIAKGCKRLSEEIGREPHVAMPVSSRVQCLDCIPPTQNARLSHSISLCQSVATFFAFCAPSYLISYANSMRLDSTSISFSCSFLGPLLRYVVCVQSTTCQQVSNIAQNSKASTCHSPLANQTYLNVNLTRSALAIPRSRSIIFHIFAPSPLISFYASNSVHRIGASANCSSKEMFGDFSI